MSKKGKYVVVRSNDSGVWCGELIKQEQVKKSGLCSVKLANARRAHYWAAGGDCSGLATHGPSGEGCRISPPVTVTVTGCCEVIEATDRAVEQWMGHTDWTAK